MEHGTGLTERSRWSTLWSKPDFRNVRDNLVADIIWSSSLRSWWLRSVSLLIGGAAAAGNGLGSST
jgi:hypothetical protein